MSAQIFGPLDVQSGGGSAADATAPLKPKAAKTTSTIAIPNLGMLLSSLLRVLLPLANEVSRRVRDDMRSEEHTSELQSRQYLVCRLLLEKKKKYTQLYVTKNC